MNDKDIKLERARSMTKGAMREYYNSHRGGDMGRPVVFEDKRYKEKHKNRIYDEER